MLLNNRDLVSELLEYRNNSISEKQLLDEVKGILDENELERNLVKKKLHSKSSTKVNEFKYDLLESDKIFHISQIKKVAINYRLRFLDSDLFKNTIPEEAVTKICYLEKNHTTKLSGFKIMAPSKAFELLYYDDPLLFVPIGNDYYYLIHKWGNDLKWYRKFLVLPIKNLSNFLFFCAIMSAVIVYFSPVDKLSNDIPLAPIILFLFMFKGVVASVGYYFFLSGKNFNAEIWNRKFKEN